MSTKPDFVNRLWRVMLVLIFSLSLVSIPSGRVSAGGAFIVTSLAEGSDANLGDGICDTGAGLCTLRAAMQEANAYAGADTINFDLGGTITLTSTLPIIYEQLTIDGIGYSVSISGNNTYRVLWVGESITVTLNHLSIVNGNVTGIPGGGGGILNYGTLSVTNCTFSGNQALKGGGIYSDTGTLQVVNSTFDGNSATQYGGAIGINDGSLAVENSTFSGNTSSIDGGAIWGHQSVGTNTMSVINSTFSGNSATTYGGGIENSYGTLIVTNSTFSGNSADYGGGIDNYGTLHLKNTILANSTSGGDCTSAWVPASEANNLIEANGCGTPVSMADPMLGALASNGGSTQTFALLPGSPAIDAGDDATCAAVPVSSLDQRGVIRPYGAHCDIGSYELMKGSLTTQSVGANDGWILESSETSSAGGTMNSAATTFRLGDDAAKKQYRGILSFATGAALPDNAIITKVTLKFMRQGILGGGNPVTMFQGFMVDIKKGIFGTAALQASDFQTAASKSYGPFMTAPVGNWYSINLTSGKAYINKFSTLSGLTQIRLRFKLDDNNNSVANYLSLYSGNAGAAYRPQLIIEYYIP